MLDDLGRPETMLRSAELRPWHTSASTAHSALSVQIQKLHRLREWVIERLNALETLARQGPTPAPMAGEVAELERALERKLSDLKETEQRLCAQAERREKEWSASLVQLEADRRLLADAGERMERERIEYLGTEKRDHLPLAQSHGPRRVAPATLPKAAVVQTRSAADDSGSNNPFAQEILRQFQSLCGDVRRSAEHRRESR
jgi:hypothetical protein